MSRLDDAALVAIKDCVGLKEGEEVLILTNFGGEPFAVAKALYDAIVSQKGKPVLVVQEEKGRTDLTERLALEAINASPDVYVFVVNNWYGKDPYGMNIGYIGRDGKKYDHAMWKVTWGDKHTRTIGTGLPGIVDVFQRCVPVDYEAMRSIGSKLKEALDAGKNIRVTSPGGTDVTFSIDGRKAIVDAGDFSKPGVYGNLPAGEVFISPVIASCKGTMVFDGAVTLDEGTVVPDEPIKVKLKDGYVSKVEGGEAAKSLLSLIEESERMACEKGLKAETCNARHIGEFGIGINPAAKPTGLILEAEKAMKTIHFAIGRNYDNDAPALIHQDCIILEPTVWVDGKKIMKNGKIL